MQNMNCKTALNELIGVFKATTGNLDKLTETVASYISWREDISVLTRTYCTYYINLG